MLKNAVFRKSEGGSKNVRKVVKIIIIVLLISAILAAVFFVIKRRLSQKNGLATAQTEYINAAVETGSITESFSGDGVLEPANSYVVTALSSGRILSSDFEEGDYVEEGQILYTLDTGTEASEKKREIKSKISGRVYTLSVRQGEEIRQGQTVAEIVDNSKMYLKLPFAAVDAEGFYAGQSAQVILDGNFETLEGKIEAVSAMEKIRSGNIAARDVTICIQNPGLLSSSQYASAMVGDAGSLESAYPEYNAFVTITAETAGTVESINVKEGDRVYEDQVILNLEKPESEYESLEAPICGTVVEKIYKAGENASAGRTMCTIYDLSYLQTQLSIDEIDIGKVSVGQTVQITADAVPGKTYTGEITKVSVVGSNAGGASYYPVTIRIDKTDGLRAGMNVSAEIIVSAAENVLTVPNEAINRGRTVLITSDSPSAANALETEAPEGYVYVAVETGQSDNDVTEIVSGLQMGDVAAYRKQTAPISDNSDEAGFDFMGGFNMNGGNGPSGGMMSPGGGNFSGGRNFSGGGGFDRGGMR